MSVQTEVIRKFATIVDALVGLGRSPEPDDIDGTGTYLPSGLGVHQA